MSSIKYSNGMYKALSSKQENKLRELWLILNPTHSTNNFDQVTGIVTFTTIKGKIVICLKFARDNLLIHQGERNYQPSCHHLLLVVC